MKLKTKLSLLIVVAIALFLSSLVIYFFLISPVDTMQKEEKILLEIDRSVANLEVAGNQILVAPLQDQIELFQKAADEYKKAYAATAKIIFLRKVQGGVSDSIKAVDNLGKLSAGDVSDFEKEIRDLTEVLNSKSSNWGSNTWTQLYADSIVDQKNEGMVLFHLQNSAHILKALTKTLNVSREVIETKDSLVQAELVKIKEMSSLIGILCILIAVLLAIVLSFLLARNITRSLSNLGSTVAKVGAGDLRVRFRDKRKDELGGLGRDIDALLDSLANAFRQIQAASAENLEVKDLLIRSVSGATSSAVQIEANSSSILAQLRKADERIQSSEADLNSVVILLEAFHSRLGVQGREVAEATQVVTELAQGIATVSTLSDQNRQAVEALLAESDRGREVFERSFAKVAEINDNVSDIQELVGTIAAIASQTNILALNAAIEAAHAGDAGKGFAVVADEISKLAAACASSSAQIAVTINAVVDKIREAGATREGTLEAFSTIGTQINRVSDQGRGIYKETDLMNRRTHRIMEVMEILTSSASDTTQEADRISNVTTKLGDALGHVGRISHEVVSNIGEITQGLTEISRTVLEVSAQADRLGNVGQDLDKAVNTFHTDSNVVGG